MHTITSSYHYGTCLERAQGPNVGLEQGILEAYKEDYFKINASPGSDGGSMRGVPSIAIRKDYWREPQVKW